ncbi:MAG: hypothetical protein Q9P01_03025 [Anaerolineae bacterium]|nr:hypothetical protein [Anaerolineae bacterium]
MKKKINPRVGRILRASTRGFDCGTHSRDIGGQHDFGAFVKVPIANTDRDVEYIHAIGVIYKIEIKDDQSSANWFSARQCRIWCCVTNAKIV